MDSQMIANWISIIGIIALGGIAIFQDKIRYLLRRPILDCEIDLKPPCCHKTITRIFSKKTGNLENEFTTYYYRLKIWNNGKISAEKVEVILTNVFKKERDDFKKIKSFPLDNLVWSIPNEEGKRKIYLDYISPNTYKYCNLGHINNPSFHNNFSYEFNQKIPIKKNETIFCFDVFFKSNILYYIVSPGEYKITIKVGCSNAATITKEYSIVITGKWYDDESKMLIKGLEIKEL